MKQHSKSQDKKKKVMKLKLKDDGMHYTANKYYSYPAFLALIDGGRGIGKTTTFLNMGLRNSLNKNEEFIYLRRYKPEIKKFVNKDSLKPMVDGVRYCGDGTGGYTAYWEDKILGYFISLSTARSYKSVDFSKVTLIIFDEAFVRQTASYRYLNDEVIQLLEFISTVQRTRTNLRVVLLGNNEDMFSPYHSFFQIPMFEGIWYDKERAIYCEHAKNSASLIEEEKKTGLWKIIRDTAYGDYHYDNKLLGEDRVNVIDKPESCTLSFRCVIEGQTINFYTFRKDNDVAMYCEYRNKVIDDNISYELVNKGKINYLNVDIFKKRIKAYLYHFYFDNKIYYDNVKGGAIVSWIIENT